jgi:hypothetical protein
MVAGFNAAGAWKVERGRPDVSVAVLDTGIRWDREGLRTQIHLNRAELPKPAGSSVYDANGDGVFNVDDYANTDGLGAKPTAEDLIHTYSDHTDADGNGYVDDIAGWDFFDDDNDPLDSSSYFAASNHGSGRAAEVAERANDGAGELGVCPHCQIVPLRVWDTFVSDQTTFALAVLYATDNGVSVIEGADGGLYHSAFAEQASEYAYQHGVAQVFSGDDLNTGNHNYPANYSHTMLIQGTAADAYGLGTDPNLNTGTPIDGISGAAKDLLLASGLPIGTMVPTATLFRGAGTTQYGGHSSVSMIGATGSENTGKAAGAAALVKAAGLDRPDGAVHLSADETREILEQTAEDVTAPNTAGIGVPDRAVAGWDPHFGWGRVDLGKAVALARDGKLPPEAAIWSPDWFAPESGSTVAITGRARARFADGFHYRLEWGAGETPAAWHPVSSGDAAGEVTDFGTIDLAAVRAELASTPHPPDGGEPQFSPGGPTPYDHEFTVRLTVTADGVPTPGVDRRVLNALDDPTLRTGFPKRVGAGGEAPVRYADLDGDGVQELVAPLEDGTVHAYRPDGSELPGWPVKTGLMKQAADHPNAPGVAAASAVAPPREPPRGPVVADLDDDGTPEVLTTAGRHLYAWEADGSVRPGFPVGIDPALCDPSDESQNPSHHYKCGFLAPPALAHLDGQDKPASIVVPALDGHLYAWGSDGAPRAGYPVALLDPSVAPADQMHAESINAPAIGDLDGDGRDDVVVATNETYGAPPPSSGDIAGLFAQGFSDLLANAAGGSSRVYAISGATGAYLPGWPVKLPGAIQTTLPLIGPGHDPSIYDDAGTPVVVLSTTGSTGIELHGADGSLLRTMQQGAYGPGSDATDRSGEINLFESAIVGDVLGQGTPAVVKYGVSLSQVVNLLLVGQNVPYNHLIGAYDASTGAPLPAFPRITDDYQFLSSSTVAKVDPSSPANQVLAGNGLGLLHAYDGLTGRDAPGFPKTTGGWLFAPAALSDDGRMAGITREGYLFEWTTDAPRCQPAGVWPSARHDDRGTGNASADGTAPGAPGAVTLERVDGTTWKLTFSSPGDDGACGTPAGYEARIAGRAIDLGSGGAVAAGTTVTRTVTLPEGGGTLALFARDEAGNRGPAARIAFGPLPAPAPAPDPATAPGPAACTDTRAPRSRFTAHTATTAGLLVRGTARDRGCAALKRVLVAVARRTHGDRCRPVGRTGRLGSARSCRRKAYLAAAGTRAWSLRIAHRLPRGTYLVFVRAIDRQGNFEPRTQANRLTLRVR